MGDQVEVRIVWWVQFGKQPLDFTYKKETDQDINAVLYDQGADQQAAVVTGLAGEQPSNDKM